MLYRWGLHRHLSAVARPTFCIRWRDPPVPCARDCCLSATGTNELYRVSAVGALLGRPSEGFVFSALLLRVEAGLPRRE